MNTLEVLVGMIGSSKSTYARKRADAGAICVAHDDLTQMCHGGEYRYEPELRQCYRQMEQSIAWAALCAGRDVVVDRTHLSLESRHRWIKWAKTYDDLQTFEGKGPTTRVVAVVFPRCAVARVHAMRRFEADARGRSFAEWFKVALHHAKQADAEPLSDTEGFDEIIRIEPDEYAAIQAAGKESHA